jgi:5-aminolevulinate synthase
MERILSTGGCPFLRLSGGISAVAPLATLRKAASQCPHIRTLATRTTPLKQEMEAHCDISFPRPPPLNYSMPTASFPRPPSLNYSMPTASIIQPSFDYSGFYEDQLDKKHADKSYRYFNNINRLAQEFPKAHTGASVGISPTFNP